MAKIEANCPEHGDIKLSHKDVTCLVFEYPFGSAVEQYKFKCPKDGAVIIKNAHSRTIDLLVAGGCKLETIEMAEELAPGVIDMPMTSQEVEDISNRLWSDDQTEY